ncbi:protoporphyrinogen oxidase HemJ [Legionella oakridgensis]|uniref:Protoporphyrinogen IX oxidase n=2 Tax=Legionella oakridgensis TaxID=29423 RepID=W0B9K1_9GAMM|nr:protoporphyrinogen oxidase HemJ [Legionella oakridgensis]AHE67223.1 hypothetical protein Loa_01676 [Legionella oakridgensis ATCC 33761 = DSM 21215]ETO93187.1 hypothetical protein LOR_48c09190 [Legionella oakridgensis RV-2-2007]KTD37978.1 transmembrane protein [Legionella oakridgensis]STY20300.1 transmembrane protein [Legionella longbeachae]
MLILKAFHIIVMVAWFAGLFYLPRLFVYHTDAKDDASMARFKIMERRLYYGITWPAAVLTTLLGWMLLHYNPQYYFHAGWMHVKLVLVIFLWGYHIMCGHFVKQFAKDGNTRSSRFFRVFNELPTILLIAIVLLVVVKPF